MTDAAGTQVTTVHLGIGRMTGITAGVRIQSGRDRQRRAPPQGRAVTGDAAASGPAVAGQVLCVIKADIEILFKAIGEAFARRVIAIDGLMTD
jgi:hypothetical protein